MHRRTAKGNRIGLAVVGVLLVLAGAALFAANRDYFGAGSSAPLYPASARRFVHDNGSWLWPVIAAVAVLVGLAFLRWLLVQPRTDRVRRLRIDSDGSDSGAGRTAMRPTALTDVVEDEIADLRGVRRVSAALSGHVDAPQLWLRVDTYSDADVGMIRRRVADDVIPDARTCLELDELKSVLRLTVSKRTVGREVR